VTPVVGGTAIVSDCAIQLSAAAQAASPVAAAWATQPFVLVDGCRFSDPNPAQLTRENSADHGRAAKLGFGYW
jgi:hypothetical protein